MKVDVNGVVRDMTPEEVAALPPSDGKEQTSEERIADLEFEVAQLTEILEAII